jgi:5-oxopent-3-ene-1,2,5-tricarboxylate decarboxylase / 2-hydroxyhepta-2,4-diene-1,7-dioate isomerase
VELSQDTTGGPPRAVELTAHVRVALEQVSVETLVHQLQKRGITSSFLTGLRPLLPEKRMVGYARTLRFVPLREDVQAELVRGRNAQRIAVEECRPDDVLVIDAREVPDAGTIGDLLAMRMLRRGAAGVVTDGALRDAAAIAAMGLPAYRQADHAATFGRRHMPFEANRPVSCAGVFVVPDDVVVGDAGGCVVIPAALAAEVASAAVEQELEESWAAEQIDAGASTLGTFPVGADRRAEFEAWRAQRSRG